MSKTNVCSNFFLNRYHPESDLTHIFSSPEYYVNECTKFNSKYTFSKSKLRKWNLRRYKKHIDMTSTFQTNKLKKYDKIINVNKIRYVLPSQHSLDSRGF